MPRRTKFNYDVIEDSFDGMPVVRKNDPGASPGRGEGVEDRCPMLDNSVEAGKEPTGCTWFTSGHCSAGRVCEYERRRRK